LSFGLEVSGQLNVPDQTTAVIPPPPTRAPKTTQDIIGFQTGFSQFSPLTDWDLEIIFSKDVFECRHFHPITQTLYFHILSVPRG
jgi:hypothetical protein